MINQDGMGFPPSEREGGFLRISPCHSDRSAAVVGHGLPWSGQGGKWVGGNKNRWCCVPVRCTIWIVSCA